MSQEGGTLLGLASSGFNHSDAMSV